MVCKKTVYILGAGASASANIPTQGDILNLVFDLDQEYFNITPQNNNLLSINIDENTQKLQKFYSTFDRYRQEIGRFILLNFSTVEKGVQYNIAMEEAKRIGNENAESASTQNDYIKKAYNIVKSENISLEDLFTVFDSVAVDREHFRLFSPQEMDRLHTELKMCIIYAISFAIYKDSDTKDYENFSDHLIEKRLSVTQKQDNIAVITMNWDNLLEKILFKKCFNYNSSLRKKQIRIFPDLCFYDFDYYGSNNHVPSTHIKAKGNRNIKILKMHGSLAWLECPKCGRIFTDYKSEIAYEEFGSKKCEYCNSDGEDNPCLRSLIITPTFKKSLDNLNIKNIWHNAFLNISDADQIVFIGYSFPEADFEMRCLLKKAVKDSAKITVVLTQYSNPDYYHNLLKNNLDDAKITRLLNRLSLPEYRYNSFFGKGRITYNYSGFEGFLKDL